VRKVQEILDFPGVLPVLEQISGKKKISCSFPVREKKTEKY
jgi:hypothetical protein